MILSSTSSICLTSYNPLSYKCKISFFKKSKRCVVSAAMIDTFYSSVIMEMLDVDLLFGLSIACDALSSYNLVVTAPPIISHQSASYITVYV